MHVLHKVLVTGGTFNPCSKKKSISRAIRLCEDSEVCSEGVAGQVEVAEPATGSTLMGGTGRGAFSTYPSGVCLFMGVKSNSSPEPESSQKLPGAGLWPVVQGGPGCCLGCLPLPQAIKEAG